MAKITVLQAKDLVKRRIDDTLPDVSDTLWLDWLNFLNNFTYRQFKSIEPELYISEQTLNVSAGTSGYTLPADFLDILDLGTGLYETDDNGDITDRAIVYTASGSSKRGFLSLSY